MHFNSGQGALTVFYDMIKKDIFEPSSIKSYMEKIYRSQEYLYRQVDEAPDCDTMLRDILERRNEMDIVIPQGFKMVFCYYLDLCDLTREFLDQYYLRARELSKRQPPQQFGDQHHILCFRYKVAEMEQDQANEKIALLCELGKTSDISKEVFMLYTTAFEQFDRQEQGLVECLFIQSRASENTEYIQKRVLNPNALRMVKYEDYYENRVAACKEGIRGIEDFLNTPVDGELTNLKDSIKGIVNKSLAEFRTITRSFTRVLPLYPVNEEDFEPIKFLFFFTTGYRSKISRSHPLLAEQRQKRIDDKKNDLVEAVDTREAEEVIENYHYPDLLELAKRDEGIIDNIVKDIAAGQRNDYPEEKEFVKQIVTSIMKKLWGLEQVRNINDSENGIKAKKERARLLLQREEMIAGKYQNLQACFDHIDEDTTPYVINGRISSQSYKCALVNDEGYARVQGDVNGITGFAIAYHYSGIHPCEVVVVKVFNMLDLGNASAEENLRNVLK